MLGNNGATGGMRSGEIREVQKGTYALHGAFTYDFVPALWRAGPKFTSEISSVTLDLQGVTRTDSAGLALMIQWLREANRHGIRIQFLNVPRQLLAIAEVSHLDHLFHAAKG
jgi:phospholipid transport system transporter-binding protein